MGLYDVTPGRDYFNHQCIHVKACRNMTSLVKGDAEKPLGICGPHCWSYETVEAFARKNSLYTRAQVRSELQKAPWKYL